MTRFEMWSGRYDPYLGGGRSEDATPGCVHALAYHQGPSGLPTSERRICVLLVFEEQFGLLEGATRAEVRMEVETARALRDKLDGLLGRLDHGSIMDDDLEDVW
jgi:hypothetical protein